VLLDLILNNSKDLFYFVEVTFKEVFNFLTQTIKKKLAAAEWIFELYINFI